MTAGTRDRFIHRDTDRRERERERERERWREGGHQNLPSGFLFHQLTRKVVRILRDFIRITLMRSITNTESDKKGRGREGGQRETEKGREAK